MTTANPFSAQGTPNTDRLFSICTPSVKEPHVVDVVGELNHNR
jgi:hypothetical protein